THALFDRTLVRRRQSIWNTQCMQVEISDPKPGQRRSWPARGHQPGVEEGIEVNQCIPQRDCPHLLPVRPEPPAVPGVPVLDFGRGRRQPYAKVSRPHGPDLPAKVEFGPKEAVFMGKG